MSQPTAFRPATRAEVKARVALAGPSGSGKTYTGLMIAAALAQGGPLAVIDTERGSASLYADEFDFDVYELEPPYSPEHYVRAIREAESAGYAVVLIDSLSHAWSGEGGVLDIVDQAAARSKSPNRFDAWRQGTPEQNRLVNALLHCPIHVVATMRSKTAYAVESDGGKTRVRKLGMEPIQRDNIEYEFTVVGEMDLDHRITITKSRLRSLQDKSVVRPDRSFGVALLRELRVGTVEPPRESEGAAGDGQAPADRGPAPAHTSAAGDGEASAAEPVQGRVPADRGPDPDTGQLATRAQVTKLHTLAGKLGWNSAEAHELAGIASFNDLTKASAHELIEIWQDTLATRASPVSTSAEAVPDQGPDGEGDQTADSGGAGFAASQEPSADVDTGELANDNQWALLDRHNLSANTILMKVRELFADANVGSKSAVTKHQFTKAFAAIKDGT